MYLHCKRKCNNKENRIGYSQILIWYNLKLIIPSDWKCSFFNVEVPWEHPNREHSVNWPCATVY